MFVFLGLGYLTQNDILKFHSFACKFDDVIVFNSWIILYSVNVYFLYPFYSVEEYLGCFKFSGYNK